jgi:hypothetical protein
MSWLNDIGQRIQAAKAFVGEAVHPFQNINYINEANDRAIRSAQSIRNAPPSQHYQNTIQNIKNQDQQFWQNRERAKAAVVPTRVTQPTTGRYNTGINQELLGKIKSQINVVDEIKKQFGGEAQQALALALAESRFDPKVYNEGPNTHAAGLFQFQPKTWQEIMPNTDLNARFDPIMAVQAAKKLRDKRGWQQWEAYNNGAYKEFMDYYNNL